ncbi:imelysin family protein [Vibrio sp. RC27]
MRIKNLIIGLGFLGLAGCSTSDTLSGFKPQQTTHISQPVYLAEFNAAQEFYTQTEALTSSFQQYCSRETSLEDVQQAWRATASKWMALQGQERGPVDALEQNWNIQFWPDKKNTTGRKMTELVNTSESLSSEYMSQQSVSVQGLGSMEWLLFDSASPIFSSTQADACRVGIAVTEHLSSNSSIIVDAWQSNPWLELDETTWESEYLSLMSNQLSFATSKLTRPLANIGQPRPYFSEAWRSKYSLHLLRLNIEALSRLYHVENDGLDTHLRAEGHQVIADRVEQQFLSILNEWPENDDLFDSLQTKAGYRQALALLNKIEQLDYLLNQEAAVALGVVIGFNATDGD